MFYLWGHSYEFDADDNWSLIEEFAEYIGNRDGRYYKMGELIVTTIKYNSTK